MQPYIELMQMLNRSPYAFGTMMVVNGDEKIGSSELKIVVKTVQKPQRLHEKAHKLIITDVKTTISVACFTSFLEREVRRD